MPCAARSPAGKRRTARRSTPRRTRREAPHPPDRRQGLRHRGDPQHAQRGRHPRHHPAALPWQDPNPLEPPSLPRAQPHRAHDRTPQDQPRHRNPLRQVRVANLQTAPSTTVSGAHLREHGRFFSCPCEPIHNAFFSLACTMSVSGECPWCYPSGNAQRADHSREPSLEVVQPREGAPTSFG